MAFHCGAPTRDGSACQRHVREPGTRCPQHRNLGGPALHPPRHAMRTIALADPALTATPAAWITARAELMARAGELRSRATPGGDEESPGAAEGSLGDEGVVTEDAEEAEAETAAANAAEDAETPEAAAAKAAEDAETAGPGGPVGPRSYLDRERSRRAQGAGEVGHVQGRAVALRLETGGHRRHTEVVGHAFRCLGCPAPAGGPEHQPLQQAVGRQPVGPVQAAG